MSFKMKDFKEWLLVKIFLLWFFLMVMNTTCSPGSLLNDGWLCVRMLWWSWIHDIQVSQMLFPHYARVLRLLTEHGLPTLAVKMWTMLTDELYQWHQDVWIRKTYPRQTVYLLLTNQVCEVGSRSNQTVAMLSYFTFNFTYCFFNHKAHASGLLYKLVFKKRKKKKNLTAVYPQPLLDYTPSPNPVKSTMEVFQ